MGLINPTISLSILTALIAPFVQMGAGTSGRIGRNDGNHRRFSSRLTTVLDPLLERVYTDFRRNDFNERAFALKALAQPARYDVTFNKHVYSVLIDVSTRFYLRISICIRQISTGIYLRLEFVHVR